MTRVWFSQKLETTALFWRLVRRDGVALGFTTHDRDLWFDGLLHRAAPGMVPSAIRRSADLEPDSAEVEGIVSHDSISSADLSAGRFDNARIAIGLVDWQSLERDILYRGAMGEVTEEAGRFTAQLTSLKAELLRDPIPRTSPTCRAAFCGQGCSLSVARFTRDWVLDAIDPAGNAVKLRNCADAAIYLYGRLRFLDGEACGLSAAITGLAGDALLLDRPLPKGLLPGHRVQALEGCDRTLATCASRFGNAVNFRGEPFLPGNDMLARYPAVGS